MGMCGWWWPVGGRDISSPFPPIGCSASVEPVVHGRVRGWASAAGSPLGCRSPLPFPSGAGQVYRAP